VGEGVSFLGFRLFPEHRRLKRRKGVHFAHTFRGLLQDYAAQRIWLDNVSVRVAGWVNHVRYANTVGLRKSVLLAQPVTRPAHSRI
jgi:RNA-directed DNA polymerase